MHLCYWFFVVVLLWLCDGWHDARLAFLLLVAAVTTTAAVQRATQSLSHCLPYCLLAQAGEPSQNSSISCTSISFPRLMTTWILRTCLKITNQLMIVTTTLCLFPWNTEHCISQFSLWELCFLIHHTRLQQTNFVPILEIEFQSRVACAATNVMHVYWRQQTATSTGSAASQEIPRIFGIRRFLTVPTSARHLSLSLANSIQSPQLPPTSRRSILILSCHLNKWHTISAFVGSVIFSEAKSSFTAYKIARMPVLYAFFWAIPWRLKFICWRFGTLCLFHLHRQVGVCRMN